MIFKENVSRSLVKSITFRILIILSDSIVIYLITKRFDTTVSLIIISNLASTVIYFIHERIWTKIHWGKYKIEI